MSFSLIKTNEIDPQLIFMNNITLEQFYYV